MQPGVLGHENRVVRPKGPGFRKKWHHYNLPPAVVELSLPGFVREAWADSPNLLPGVVPASGRFDAHAHGPFTGTKKDLAKILGIGSRSDRRTLDSMVRLGFVWRREFTIAFIISGSETKTISTKRKRPMTRINGVTKTQRIPSSNTGSCIYATCYDLHSSPCFPAKRLEATRYSSEPHLRLGGFPFPSIVG